ncbi:MAG TPA: hypothetical protein ENH46_04725 [Candidatus Pacearchaeota archaeon]|nr:hypothetical protein [Candidatus Pacearchaeota archaeon]
MKEIKSKRYGLIHYHAQCTKCNWECAILTDETKRPQDVRNKVYSHVRKTGHSVHLEGGTSTNYSINQS